MEQLTQAVFDLPECPEWAKSAAADEEGQGWWISTTTDELEVHESDGLADCLLSKDRTAKLQFIGHGFDNTDWQNSAINREV